MSGFFELDQYEISARQHRVSRAINGGITNLQGADTLPALSGQSVRQAEEAQEARKAARTKP